ncbi:MAG: hypothetical protein IKW50_01955, partial [Oscillospiraceae bacterium]|nr:hypothetical protein [Oscillospiraceae bacterium]
APAAAHSFEFAETNANTQHFSARALTERPYIHNGKCCDFAGKQWEFVIFACREAKRLPYDTHGRLCKKLEFEVAEPNRAVMLDDCRITSHELPAGASRQTEI